MRALGSCSISMRCSSTSASSSQRAAASASRSRASSTSRSPGSSLRQRAIVLGGRGRAAQRVLGDVRELLQRLAPQLVVSSCTRAGAAAARTARPCAARRGRCARAWPCTSASSGSASSTARSCSTAIVFWPSRSSAMPAMRRRSARPSSAGAPCTRSRYSAEHAIERQRGLGRGFERRARVLGVGREPIRLRGVPERGVAVAQVRERQVAQALEQRQLARRILRAAQHDLEHRAQPRPLRVLLVDRGERRGRFGVHAVDRQHALVAAHRARGIADLVLEHLGRAEAQVHAQLDVVGVVGLVREHVDQTFEVAHAAVQRLQAVPVARLEQRVADRAQRATVLRLDLEDPPPARQRLLVLVEPLARAAARASAGCGCALRRCSPA